MDAGKVLPEVIEGRDHIARLAEKDGEHTFAREVRAGCWDHREDVSFAITRAKLLANFWHRGSEYTP